MENWDDYRYFLAVASEGTLLAASKKLKTTHSTVLRRIKSLEEHLQVRLFDHLSSGYVLTPAGKDILQSIENLQNQIKQAEFGIAGNDGKLSGNIKISTSDTLGYYWLPKYIKMFKEEYPNISLDLDITNQLSSLTRREADIIISPINRHPDTMIGRILQPISFGLYAHKNYIKKYGRPENLDSLQGFHFLIGNDKLSNAPPNIFLKNKINPKDIVVKCDKFSGLNQLCDQALGIAPLPEYVAAKNKNLEKLFTLPEEFQKNAIWMLTHPNLSGNARIKIFMKFMKNKSKTI